MNITNHYTPGKTSVTVTKNWNDSENKHKLRQGKIKVQFYANDEAVGKEMVLNEKNQWTYTWEDLDEKANGETIN